MGPRPPGGPYGDAAEESAYGTVAARAPQTVAHALDDSPVGLLGFAGALVR